MEGADKSVSGGYSCCPLCRQGLSLLQYILYSRVLRVWQIAGRCSPSIANNTGELDSNAARSFTAATPACALRGSLYARNNAYDRAIADFNEAIRLEPKASYFLNRGNAYNLKGDPDRAIADYNEALRLEPDLSMAYNNRGVAWRDKGDKERALADFSAAVRIDPDLVIAVEHRKRMEHDIASAGARPAKPPTPASRQRTKRL